MNDMYSLLRYMALVFLAVLTGCASVPEPTNIEPVISVEEASDVTRTGATVTATVMTQGTGKIARLQFRYGQTPDMEQQSPYFDVDADKVSWQMTDLIPGKVYYFCATGGNGKATVTSEVMTFETMHNERPEISGASILSYGPMSMFVGFDIVSDGGLPITEAGCDVLDISTGEKTRHLIEDASPLSEMQRVFIFVSSAENTYSVTPFAANEEGETTGETVFFTSRKAFSLSMPGLLSRLIGSRGYDSDSIVIMGKMDGDDFRFLRRMLGAPTLPGEDPLSRFISMADITDVEIVEGGASYDGNRFVTADVISTGLFADCSELSEIMLPVSAKSIMREAFQGCGRLTSLTVPANISTVLPSSNCIALSRIDVSAANPFFKSSEGVLFNRDFSGILWFPPAKDGSFTVPSTVKSIGEETFRGSSLSSLIISDGMTGIGRGALAESNLVEVTLPADLVNIPEALFQNSRRLSTVRIGSGTEYVGDYVFDGCPLRNLYVDSFYPPFLSKNAFGNSSSDIYDNCVLHVNPSSLPLFRTHSEWGKFKNISAISTNYE